MCVPELLGFAFRCPVHVYVPKEDRLLLKGGSCLGSICNDDELLSLEPSPTNNCCLSDWLLQDCAWDVIVVRSNRLAVTMEFVFVEFVLAVPLLACRKQAQQHRWLQNS